MEEKPETILNLKDGKFNEYPYRNLVYQVKNGIFLIFTEVNQGIKIIFPKNSHLFIFPFKSNEENFYLQGFETKFIWSYGRSSEACISSLSGKVFILLVNDGVEPDILNHRLSDNFLRQKKSFFATPMDSLTKVCLGNISMEIFSGKKRRIFLKQWGLKLLNSVILNINEGFNLFKSTVVGIEDQKKLYEAKNILIENMASPPDLKELAKMCSINEHKLKNGFKNLFGYPPKSFLRKLRMEKAKELIMEKGISVTETALYVGYSNPSAFSAVFSKFHGFPPSHFKNR